MKLKALVAGLSLAVGFVGAGNSPSSAARPIEQHQAPNRPAHSHRAIWRRRDEVGGIVEIAWGISGVGPQSILRYRLANQKYV